MNERMIRFPTEEEGLEWVDDNKEKIVVISKYATRFGYVVKYKVNHIFYE